MAIVHTRTAFVHKYKGVLGISMSTQRGYVFSDRLSAKLIGQNVVLQIGDVSVVKS